MPSKMLHNTYCIVNFCSDIKFTRMYDIIFSGFTLVFIHINMNLMADNIIWKLSHSDG